ncbi:MAG: glycosyltransferase family 9 protein [Crocinitomicaceae bacterium]|nr:glycosyltransferase family 9 protein [Crocinitomicaceae bacterium]MBK8926523.1 glycosyltransferase family 9 protein [Crocinitomicaceae bacterium]
MPKFLIVRFSSIGDIVLTTPVVRCIKKQVPGAEVHYVTKKSFSHILESNPHISKIFTIEKDVSEVAGALRDEQYDFIVDLHNNLRSSILKQKLGVKSASFPKLNVKKFLLTKFKIDRLPELHVVDRYFAAVKSWGVHPDMNPCDYFIPPHDEVNPLQFDLPEKFIAFAIGAQLNTKKLPNEKIISIIQKIKMPVAILGGKTDFENGEQIAAACSNAVNLCGKMNLNQSASIIRQCEKMVTHDTGLMHIASCFKKKIISVWGNTVPSFGMYPYSPMDPHLYSMHEVKGLNCRPCSKIGYPECPKKHFNCMQQQNVDAIVKCVNQGCGDMVTGNAKAV